MRIVLLGVGKARTKYFDEAIVQYQQRLQRLTNFDLVVVPNSDKAHETERLLKYIASDDYVVLLDERGKQMSSPALADFIEDCRNRSRERVVFVIGGAHGVEPGLFDRANLVWALSELVFPHELVRLIAVEQLYRACDLLAGGKYHHE